MILRVDFFSTVTEVHSSLNDSTTVQSRSYSNDTLSRLAETVLAMKEDKKKRLHKVNIICANASFLILNLHFRLTLTCPLLQPQELATQLIDLWKLVDT